MPLPVYQGQEQHLSGAYNPVNREAVWLSGYNTSGPLYPYITTLNAFRNQVVDGSSDYLTYFKYTTIPIRMQCAKGMTEDMSSQCSTMMGRLVYHVYYR